MKIKLSLCLAGVIGFLMLHGSTFAQQPMPLGIVPTSSPPQGAAQMDSYFGTPEFTEFIKYANQDAMEGYAFKDYVGFWDKWHLVVARYREDNHEIRLIYANDLAWKTIQQGKTEFPDGATFGKVAYMAERDVLFLSSLVPGRVHRYQLMVKDSKKHADTRGWGYAIFGAQGKTLPDNPQRIVASCAQCHEIARPRGYVFLGRLDPTPRQGLMPFSNSVAPVKVSTPAPKDEPAALGASGLRFQETKTDDMPVFRDGIKTPTVDVLVGGLADSDHIFTGTLSEMTPMLIDNSERKNTSSALISRDHQYWVVVIPKGDGCFAVFSRDPGVPPLKPMTSQVCRR